MERRGVILMSGRSHRCGMGVSYPERSRDRLMDELRIIPSMFPNSQFRQYSTSNDDAQPTNDLLYNTIHFTKEQFATSLRLHIPSLVKQFLHYSDIPPLYVYPKVIRILMGCSMLNMLFQLDITLFEILLIYAIKMST